VPLGSFGQPVRGRYGTGLSPLQLRRPINAATYKDNTWFDVILLPSSPPDQPAAANYAGCAGRSARGTSPHWAKYEGLFSNRSRTEPAKPSCSASMTVADNMECDMPFHRGWESARCRPGAASRMRMPSLSTPLNSAAAMRGLSTSVSAMVRFACCGAARPGSTGGMETCQRCSRRTTRPSGGYSRNSPGSPMAAREGHSHFGLIMIRPTGYRAYG